MPHQDASVFQQEIMGFFFAYFSQFEFFKPMSSRTEYAYYYNYRAYQLSIVVFLPLIRNEDDQLELTDRRMRIVLKKTHHAKKPYLIELTDTLLTASWQDRIRERIGVLQELMAEIHKCDICSVYKIPKISRTNNLKRTMFVSLQCPVCHKYTSTIFGRGLKTRLHRNLKRTRSE